MLLQFKSCPYTFIQIRDLYALNKLNSHWYYESVLFDEHLFYVFNYIHGYYYGLHIIIITSILTRTYSMRTLELEYPIVFSYHTEVIIVIFT